MADTEPRQHRPLTLDDIGSEFHRLSLLLDNGLSVLRQRGRDYAASESEYRRQRHAHYRIAAGNTVDERKAEVDAETAGFREARDLAEYDRQAALEAVRARRQQMSALQTLANAHRAEAEFVRTGPHGGDPI